MAAAAVSPEPAWPRAHAHVRVRLYAPHPGRGDPARQAEKGGNAERWQQGAQPRGCAEKLDLQHLQSQIQALVVAPTAASAQVSFQERSSKAPEPRILSFAPHLPGLGGAS